MKHKGCRVFTASLGCDKNLVDTEHMLGLLAEKGFTFTDDETEADAALVNTCCFIHDAKQESVRTILELAGLRREGSLKALVVTGCFAERYKEEIKDAIPEVDAVLGTASTDRVADALKRALAGSPVDFFDDVNRAFKTGTKRMLTGSGHVAYLKIAEGCDKHCTYCIIPSLRGKYRSVPENDLIREAKLLDARGVKELVLVAQETTRYGMDKNGKKQLSRLLRRLCRETEGIRWIRLLYCYPEEIDDDLIETIRTEEKIVKYLDIPVQSGSDAVLKRMNRKTTNAEIRALVAKLRKQIPGICLRTTLIAGFPGETAADHRASMDLVRDLRFDRLGVFTYSREEGTPAHRMRNQVTEPLKKRRRTQLMKLQQEIAFANGEQLTGKRLDVMVEGELEEDEEGRIVYAARTSMDAPDVDGMLFFTDRRNRSFMTGDFVKVRVTDAAGYDLIGETV